MKNAKRLSVAATCLLHCKSIVPLLNRTGDALCHAELTHGQRDAGSVFVVLRPAAGGHLKVWQFNFYVENMMFHFEDVERIDYAKIRKAIAGRKAVFSFTIADAINNFTILHGHYNKSYARSLLATEVTGTCALINREGVVRIQDKAWCDKFITENNLQKPENN